MQEETKVPRLKTLFFTSVWVIPVFLVIPVYIIVNLRLHRPVSGNLLLTNNFSFALFCALRLVWYLKRIKLETRYLPGHGMPRSSQTVERPAEVLKSGLARAGYRFSAGGRYGEKRNLGYLGTALIYGGVALLLLVGSYDYMREYSIMVRLGVGLPIPLDGKGLSGEFEAGSLAATSRLPLLHVKQQVLPSKQYPKGATEIELVDKEGKVLSHTFLTPGKPFNYGSLDYHMIKYIFDGLVTIREGKYIIFDEFIKFMPLPQKKGSYSYYAPVVSKVSKVKGEAWLNPEKKEMKIIGKLGDKEIINTDLDLWGEHKKAQGNYETSWEGLAQWSELRVARERHRGLLLFGGIMAVLGLVVRALFHPQRVWLEEEGAVSRVKVCGAGTRRLIAELAKG